MTAPQVHRFRRIASTLDVLHDLAAQGAPDRTIVVAEEQTAGRGSRGRVWHSPVGGLWYSQVCRPASRVAAEIVSLRTGLALAHALDALGGLPRIALKWPNDLLIEGRKVGGILCEARWPGGSLGWVAVGLGLNVTNGLSPDLDASATTLSRYRPDLRPDHLIAPISSALAALSAGGDQLSSQELEAFADRDWLRGRPLDQPIPGTALGIRADGGLEVLRPDGVITSVRAGSVVLALPHPASPVRGER